MVSMLVTAAIAASTQILIAISPVSAFSPSPVARCRLSSRSSSLSASGKGFGEKTVPKSKPKPASISPTPAESQLKDSPTLDDSSIPTTQENTGSALLAELRTRQAEQRNAELQKIANLRKTDEALLSDPSAAAIPERVAQRMGKRMLPFVGVPLLGSMASFVGFWYMATFRDMEFQPAVVATVSFVFLAVGLLGITYSVLSASWDDDREGSTLGFEEFSKNIESLKEGLSRTKENALLRERMAGMSEEEIRKVMEE
ncbi:hypothetical protein HJC23_012738 [Cyclotella cryptica]|uniref:Uncharacterized protein n=1 Tax=Cyclotella cryptica TaxID=29204 RepID=A0ABD3P8H4_9STRA|eukprot:CCRYP_016782-RA/>CCRYP_016782-RA protein AED:0.07 eAED:0.07 QI:90/1/1/1/1/1/2/166/256